MADCQAIKTEYITTDTSYRKLAQKYGINVTTIAKTAGAEGWVEQRKQYANETQAKTLEKISQQEVNRAAKIHSVADKLLLKIEAMVDSERPLDTKGIRALTAAVKDLKEIQSVKSALDKQEQEARIANLRKQADKEDDNKEPIQVIIGGDLMEYSK
jgi:Trp operon repressor